MVHFFLPTTHAVIFKQNIEAFFSVGIKSLLPSNGISEK